MKQTNLYRKLLEISAKYGISVSDLISFFEVLSNGQVKNAELTTKTGLSKVLLANIKKDLTIFLLPVSQFTGLNEHGLNAYNELQTQINIDYADLEAELDEIIAERPDQSREYDQFHATKETVLKRVKQLNENHDLRGKDIVFLGDDDFTSVAISLLNVANSITVFEIDKRIISSITKLSGKYKVKINIINTDLINRPDSNQLNLADVVFTDPPYTKEGVSLFLSRAIQSLKFKNKNGRIYFCYGNSDLSKEKFVAIQKVISESGLMIQTVIDKFNKYMGADSIGNSSSLYICETTPKTLPLIKGKYNGKLYTND